MPLSLNTMNNVLQRGRKIRSSILGQAYDVRRLTATSNISILNDAPVLPAYRADIQRTTKRDLLENTTFDLLRYIATCDDRSFQIGDVCTEVGLGSEGATFVMAQRRVLRQTIWVRADFRATIERQPTLQPAGSWSAEQRDTNLSLVLVNGSYSYASITTTPAIVPVGIQPVSRIAETRIPDIPEPFGVRRYLAYVPLLPDATLQEQDQLVIDDADRYEVMSIYSSGAVGFVGYIAVVRKLD